MTSQLRNSQDFSCWLGLASSACSTNPVLCIRPRQLRLDGKPTMILQLLECCEGT